MRSPSAQFPGKTLTNQNELLTRYPGAFAGKTGFTNLARNTYVGAAQRGNRRLVVVRDVRQRRPVRPGDPPVRLGFQPAR